MRTFARITLAAAALMLLPMAASAQTSVIAGTVKDASGAVLPGVTVEVASPALIEKVRTATTDGAGQFKITNLVTGTYTVTFSLPGFSLVKRENVELTSDFTAVINGDMKVGALEETITVAAESPIVDTQSITTRTVMTREVLDAIPTGRNIQAVGIMIPGTAIAVGGGGAISRDVGGSGNLQQSPLQYRGSADTVQTIEGMRLNNLCAQGAYSGVYWNEGSFQEFSYVTGADSAEMGQGGIRVNMVPKDGGNTFHGFAFANYEPNSLASDNCGSAGVGKACSQSNLTGDTTFNKTNNFLTNVAVLTKNYDTNMGLGGPIMKDRAWFFGTFRYLGVNKTVPDSFYNVNAPIPGKFVPYVADTSRPAIDDGHIRSFAGRVSAQISQKDKVSYYHDEQDKVRGHWGISSTVTPEASAIEPTPTSFVSVTKWTRTQSSKLLFEGGLGIYDQEYQEVYQSDAAGQVTINDAATTKISNAWNNPADHFSKLFTESFSASYVTGSHSFKFGGTITEGRWRLVQQFNSDVQQVNYNAGAPVSVVLRIPTDRRNAIKADTGIFAQDRWTIRRATINAGLRYDQFIGAALPETLPASTWNASTSFNDCPDGVNNLQSNCTGRVQNWKDINPRVGVSFDVFGNGKTAVKASVARYVAGQQIATADANNPETTVGLTDTRAWTDRDFNGSPFGSNGAIQLNELTNSTSTVNFGKNIATTTTTDPTVLNGWGVRGYNWEYAISAQHELAPKVSLNGGWYRRSFGNQTVTVDNRYSFAKNSFDGPFCVNAPADVNLPNGGGYQVCGLYDLKPAVVAQNLPASSTSQLSSNFGGETNIYEGFEVSTMARFSQGAFFSAGINATKRIFDQCNLVAAGILGVVTGAGSVSEVFPDGSAACHQDLPYRPDFKMLGSYTLPYDVQVSGTFQFTRGVQNGGAAPSVLATWSTTPASATTIGQFRTPAAYSAGATTKSVNLMAVGQNYGNDNLAQLDLRASKRFRFQGYRFRVDFDAYNVTNSDWPFTVNTTFSTAATSNYLKPTNVLQARFIKFGATFDF
jgi:hypothetical protein